MWIITITDRNNLQFCKLQLLHIACINGARLLEYRMHHINPYFDYSAVKFSLYNNTCALSFETFQIYRIIFPSNRSINTINIEYNGRISIDIIFHAGYLFYRLSS